MAQDALVAVVEPGLQERPDVRIELAGGVAGAVLSPDQRLARGRALMAGTEEGCQRFNGAPECVVLKVEAGDV